MDQEMNEFRSGEVRGEVSPDIRRIAREVM
jgi:hypothetical protein